MKIFAKYTLFIVLFFCSIANAQIYIFNLLNENIIASIKFPDKVFKERCAIQINARDKLEFIASINFSLLYFQSSAANNSLPNPNVAAISDVKLKNNISLIGSNLILKFSKTNNVTNRIFIDLGYKNNTKVIKVDDIAITIKNTNSNWQILVNRPVKKKNTKKKNLITVKNPGEKYKNKKKDATIINEEIPYQF